jgi:hypothetical protein
MIWSNGMDWWTSLQNTSCSRNFLDGKWNVSIGRKN